MLQQRQHGNVPRAEGRLSQIGDRLARLTSRGVQVPMAGIATVVGELRPHGIVSTLPDQVELGLCRHELTDAPGAGFERWLQLAVVLPLFIPVQRKPRQMRGKLKAQPRMSCGDQVVIHFASGSPYMTLRTQPRSADEILGVGETELMLFLKW